MRMKKCRIDDVNLGSLPAFSDIRKYPLYKAGFFGTKVTESNISMIFKKCLDARQIIQLTYAERSASSLKNASTLSTIPKDVDRDVKCYIYEMAAHFVEFGALRCILNSKLVIEITEVRVAPAHDIDFHLNEKPDCPLLVASFYERNVGNIKTFQDVLKWKIFAQRLSESTFQKMYLNYDVAGPVYDAILCILTTNTSKLFPLYAAHQRVPFGFRPTFILPLPSEPEGLVKPPADPLICHFPGCDIHAERRCGRCLLARYCCSDHQNAHWEEHKKTCNRRPTLNEDDSIVVSIGAFKEYWLDFGIVSNGPSQPVHQPGDGAGLKSKFLIKVQPMLFTRRDGFSSIYIDGPIVIFDATRALDFRVVKNEEHKHQHQKLLSIVATRGVVTSTGLKTEAYFYAKKEDAYLRIYMEEVSETPDW